MSEGVLQKVREKSTEWDSKGKPKNFRVRWQAQGFSNLEAAAKALIDTVPKKMLGIAFSGVSLNEDLGDAGIYEFEANYDTSTAGGTDGLTESEQRKGTQDNPNYSCDIAYTTTKMKYAPGDQNVIIKEGFKGVTKEDIGRILGYRMDGNHEGIDVLRPALSETYSYTVRGSRFSGETQRKLGEMVGKVNKSGFKGWAPGEVLFAGATINKRWEDNEPWFDVSLKFLIQMAESGVEICSGIKLNQKRGWDAVWTCAYEVFDEEKKKKVNTIVAAAVAKVYQDADFNGII